jgi:hypothetical protein
MSGTETKNGREKEIKGKEALALILEIIMINQI